MRKLVNHVLLLFLAAIALSACKNGKTFFGADAPDTLCVDSFRFAKIDSNATRTVEVDIRADYPSPITGPLSANIASWIRKNFNVEAAPADTMYGQKVVDFYGKQYFDNYMTDESPARAFSYIADARLVCKRRHYVTYVFTAHEYTGGAHAMTTIKGATFSQTDGAQYGWEMLKDTAKTSFRKLLKKGVRKYFSTDVTKGEITDDELATMLLLNPDGTPVTAEQLDNFPLPKTPPYLTRKGVTFVYNAYEIAPYAAGAPTFTIDFDDLKGFLSKTGKQLIRKKEK